MRNNWQYTKRTAFEMHSGTDTIVHTLSTLIHLKRIKLVLFYFSLILYNVSCCTDFLKSNTFAGETQKDCTDETILDCMAIADMDDDNSCTANLCGGRYGEQKTY